VGRRPSLLLGVALAAIALELATAWTPPYGLYHDELYYWAGAQRLGLGYVDHPPLAPWLLAACTALLGDGRLAFRLLPALCFAGTVLLTGWMAGRLGAGRFGQLVAGLCVALAPFTLVHFSFFSVNAIEIFLWTLATCLLLELIRTGNQRLWLGLGAVAGIALLQTHLRPARRHARARRPREHRALGSRPAGSGSALAGVLLAIPNLALELLNDWPSLRSIGIEGEGPCDLRRGAGL
jgi:dolichol-phosphate mannosyltransferase